MRVHWSIFLSAPGTVRLLIYCKLDEYKIVLNCGFNLPLLDYWLGGACFHLFINLVTFSLTCLFISFGYFSIELFFSYFSEFLINSGFHLLVALFVVFSSGMWLVFSYQVVICCISVLLFEYSQ